MSTNGLKPGLRLIVRNSSASAEPTLPTELAAPTNTIPTTVLSSDQLAELTTLQDSILTNLTELERLAGLLTQCNRDIAGRLKDV